jgi:hypothetical protein
VGPTITSRRNLANAGQKAKELMRLNLTLNTWAKTVFLGAAVLLASTAFASNKGSLQIREKVEVNGQQLAAGEYQLRWTGSGSDVEVSFMQGKKEVVKTTAKVVSLNETSNFDSAVVDHANGKAATSQVRFAGKKFALVIGDTDKAEMSAGK